MQKISQASFVTMLLEPICLHLLDILWTTYAQEGIVLVDEKRLGHAGNISSGYTSERGVSDRVTIFLVG